MNLAGKILVVALFIMSLMFATFSIMVYASHRNWRDEIMRAAPVGNQDVGLKEQYNRKTVENEHLTTAAQQFGRAVEKRKGNANSRFDCARGNDQRLENRVRHEGRAT